MSADANENCYKNFRISYCCFGRPMSSLHTPERNQCKVWSVDVSGPGKATQGTNNLVDFLKAGFIGYLRTRATSAVSSASESSTSTTRMKTSEWLSASVQHA